MNRGVVNLTEPKKKTTQSEPVGVPRKRKREREREGKTLSVTPQKINKLGEQRQSTQRRRLLENTLPPLPQSIKPFMECPVTPRVVSHWPGRCRRGGATGGMRVEEAGCCGPRLEEGSVVLRGDFMSATALDCLVTCLLTTLRSVSVTHSFIHAPSFVIELEKKQVICIVAAVFSQKQQQQQKNAHYEAAFRELC